MGAERRTKAKQTAFRPCNCAQSMSFMLAAQIQKTHDAPWQIFTGQTSEPNTQTQVTTVVWYNVDDSTQCLQSTTSSFPAAITNPAAPFSSAGKASVASQRHVYAASPTHRLDKRYYEIWSPQAVYHISPLEGILLWTALRLERLEL